MRGAANRRRRYGRAFLSLFRIKAAEGLQYRVAALAKAPLLSIKMKSEHWSIRFRSA